MDGDCIDLILTNERISDYLNYLSKDRWVRLIINSDKYLQKWPLDTSNGITPCYINESRNPLKINQKEFIETIKK